LCHVAFNLAGAAGVADTGKGRKVLDHFSIAVSDLPRSTRFYDAVLETLGYNRVFGSDDATGYAAHGQRDDVFAIRRSESGFVAPAQMHIAFAAPDRNAVTRFHEVAVRLGATPDGEPGLHPEYGDGYFASFVIGPDGYRLEAVVHEAK
jgi:catechol 2,3-dioxygenase-like lactoylglutathione lyase family enzyme